MSGVHVNADALKVTVPHTAARTDINLAEAARQALAWDVEVPDDRVRLTVAS